MIRKPSRALLYALAGGVLSLGEVIGLLVVRELSGAPALVTELLQERITYLYVLVTTAIVLACLGYALGRQTDRLAALSETDALTELPNRRALRRRLTLEIRRASRYHSPVSLLIIDVDGLKRVNDARGHAAGDRLIRRVAASITATLRGSDLGARWGGDEFAIVMPNSDPDAARHLAERLMTHLAEQAPGSADDGPVTVSIGIATFDPARTASVTRDQLARSADEALYAAKAAGRNRIRTA
jgi:diguanylate cyclase (GGDEF)-like protein